MFNLINFTNFVRSTCIQKIVIELFIVIDLFIYVYVGVEIDTTQYVLLYSLYSWPNVVLSVFGGFLLDRVFGI